METLRIGVIVPMGKHGSVEKLAKIARSQTPCLAICAGKDCAKAGAKHIIRAAQAALAEQETAQQVPLVLTKCQDRCDDGPVAAVLPGEFPYCELTPAAISAIVTEHIGQGRPQTSYLPKKIRRKLARALTSE